MFGNKTYKISANEDWIAPEEALIDSSSDYDDMEMPITNSVFRTGVLISAALVVLVLAAVFNLSVRNFDRFAAISFNNRTVNFALPPPRGIIFDRVGKPLVENVPVFDLLVISKEARENEKIAADAGKLAEILKLGREEFTKTIQANITTTAIFFAASGLDKDQVLAIKNLNPRGFYIVPNTKRHYIDGQQFSHILGYVGKVSKEDLRDRYYYPTDVKGRLGLEYQYEETLRGEHGQIFFQHTGEDLDKDPQIGNSLVLNVDYQAQKDLFNAMFGVLRDTSYSKAAAIVQDPRDGSVLAMVSFPTYDNNAFIEGLTPSQFSAYFESQTKPMFNRVIGGVYNPGSTIKPLMGLMALQERIVSPSDTIQDCVGLTVVNPYNPSDTYTFGNWRAEYGLFNLRKAIANSCNVYFYTVGGGNGGIQGLGIERIVKYLRGALADKKLGIDLPGEASGFVPSADWKLTERREAWYLGDTYNVSIGQGDLIVTPLWLNSYISAVANGGTIWEPHLVKQVLDKDKNVIETIKPEAIGKLDFRPEVLREVKSAMQETVLSGTARMLQQLPVSAGAKTGTAEVVKGGANNSLMTAFAPFDNPEVNITVLVEGTTGSEGYAIRIAYEFLKAYFAPVE